MFTTWINKQTKEVKKWKKHKILKKMGGSTTRSERQSKKLG